MDDVPFLLMKRLTAARSAALSVTLKLVPLVISTLVVVSVRVAPPSPLTVSLLTSMSLVTPLSLRNPAPVTTITPVLAS